MKTTVVIKKNGIVIKQFTVTDSKKVNSILNRAIDIAGGMWNGKDEFTVEVL